jgi:ABC-type multidrug transport system fused ATPase/permease subunit
LRDHQIILRHILPNALTPIITFAPFSLVGAIASLAALDYLGFGLPALTPPSDNSSTRPKPIAPPGGLPVPVPPSLLSSCLGVFIGEGVREACDPTTPSPLGVDHASATGNQDLTIAFDTEDGPVTAVKNLSLTIEPGQILGLVGESGCGKSVTAMSILRLLPRLRPVSQAAASCFHGHDFSPCLSTSSSRSGEPHLHDLPGTHDGAFPAPSHRKPT